MRFYTARHKHTCGVDLHTRSMYVCVLDPEGKPLLHEDLPADPASFLKAIAPFRDDLVVGAECTFSWYWLADLCQDQQIPFILGHALYMKAIHGGKAKNDRIDAAKIARLLQGGLLPQAYVYPRIMRATRDLLRRRMRMVRLRADLLAHIQNTCSQYNLPQFTRKLCYAANREGALDRFRGEGLDPAVADIVQADLASIEHFDELIAKLELRIVRLAKEHDPQALARLQSIPGVGKVLSLVLLYEIQDVGRFPRVQEFLSYARLIRPEKTSAGKKAGEPGGRKIGNAHLKFAFSEAACLMLRERPEAKRWLERRARTRGKAKALSVLAARIGRAVYYMLKRQQAFDATRFFATM